MAKFVLDQIYATGEEFQSALITMHLLFVSICLSLLGLAQATKLKLWNIIDTETGEYSIEDLPSTIDLCDYDFKDGGSKTGLSIEVEFKDQFLLREIDFQLKNDENEVLLTQTEQYRPYALEGDSGVKKKEKFFSLHGIVELFRSTIVHIPDPVDQLRIGGSYELVVTPKKLFGRNPKPQSYKFDVIECADRSIEIPIPLSDEGEMLFDFSTFEVLVEPAFADYRIHWVEHILCTVLGWH